MTSYEILMGKKLNLKYFHIFECVCYALNDREHLAKFDSKSDKCLFLGYSKNIRAYRMFNLQTSTIIESINVVLDDLADLKGKTAEDNVEELLEIPVTQEDSGVSPGVATPSTTPRTTPPIVVAPTEELHKEDDSSGDVNTEKNIPSRIQKDHPSSQIIGDPHGGIQNRQKERVDYRKMIGLVCMTSVYCQVSHSLYHTLNQRKLMKI